MGLVKYVFLKDPLVCPIRIRDFPDPIVWPNGMGSFWSSILQEIGRGEGILQNWIYIYIYVGYSLRFISAIFINLQGSICQISVNIHVNIETIMFQIFFPRNKKVLFVEINQYGGYKVKTPEKRREKKGDPIIESDRRKNPSYHHRKVAGFLRGNSLVGESSITHMNHVW